MCKVKAENMWILDNIMFFVVYGETSFKHVVSSFTPRKQSSVFRATPNRGPCCSGRQDQGDGRAATWTGGEGKTGGKQKRRGTLDLMTSHKMLLFYQVHRGRVSNVWKMGRQASRRRYYPGFWSQMCPLIPIDFG